MSGTIGIAGKDMVSQPILYCALRARPLAPISRKDFVPSDPFFPLPGNQDLTRFQKAGFYF